MTKMIDKPIVEWTNLYKERWNDLISPSAISHPAKFSHGLIRRIYEYALEQGYIKPNDKILDCFGGVGLGSFYAVNNGLIWLGNELEDKFYKDAYKNFALWCERFWCVCDDPEYLNLLRQYATKPDEESPQLNLFSAQEGVNPDDLLEQIKAHALASWDKPNKGSYCSDCSKLIVAYPVLLKGDSRRLTEVIGEQVGGVVSSPPYEDTPIHKFDTKRFGDNLDKTLTEQRTMGYGDSSNQLGNMPAGQLSDALISSSPFSPPGNNPTGQGQGVRSEYREGKHKHDTPETTYGSDEAQLGAMPMDGFDSIISSSPFADSIGSDDPDKRGGLFTKDAKRYNDKNLTATYGNTKGQLGKMPEGSLNDEVNYDTGRTGQANSKDVSRRNEYKRDRGTIQGDRHNNSIPSQEDGHTNQESERSISKCLQEGQSKNNPNMEGYESNSKADRSKSREDQGGESLELEGRQSKTWLSSQNQERALRDLQDNGEISDPSQGLRSLQQRPEQSTSSLCNLSSEVTRDSTKRSETEREANTEIKRPSGLEIADCSISSPSFAGNTGGRGEASRNGIDPALFDRSSGGMKRGTGDSEDNLDHLPMTGFEEAVGGLVSSPPYEGLDLGGGGGIINRDDAMRKTHGFTIGDGNYSVKGNTNNQLGNSTSPTFWQAAKDILLECHKLLRPHAVSFWVVKNYVKSGRIINFVDQWRILCESCGFEHIETIIAWQTEDKGTNYDLDGGKQKKIVKRKSFFRLIFEKKFPELSIDAEVVLVMRKRG